MNKWLKIVLCCLTLLALSFSLVACSSNSRKSVKSKYKGIVIYPVRVTKVKVEHDVDEDCLITVEGNTDAPDGSIVYAQHQIHDEMTDNKAYGGNDDESGAEDTKVKHHHISFAVLASNLFDLGSMKAGQKTYLKIFCAKQKISNHDEIYGDDSEIISKKVRKTLSHAYIKPYAIKVSKYMVHVAQYD